MTNDWIDTGSGEQEHSEIWDFKKKKEIIGIYKKMQLNVGPNKNNMYFIETEGGLLSIWGTALLNDRFSKIPQGSEVKLTYLGKTQGESGREYHNFKVLYREVK